MGGTEMNWSLTVSREAKILRWTVPNYKIRAKYPTCKGGDESPCAEGTII